MFCAYKTSRLILSDFKRLSSFNGYKYMSALKKCRRIKINKQIV